MKSKLFSHPYIIINFIFIVTILFFFLYFQIFSSESDYPLKSNYTVFTGITSISSGLSRSISSAVRFDFNRAKEYNPYGIRIFGFFIIQLIFRMVTIMVILKSNRVSQVFVRTDILVSVILFVILFKPFIIEAICSGSAILVRI